MCIIDDTKYLYTSLHIYDHIKFTNTEYAQSAVSITDLTLHKNTTTIHMDEIQWLKWNHFWCILEIHTYTVKPLMWEQYMKIILNWTLLKTELHFLRRTYIEQIFVIVIHHKTITPRYYGINGNDMTPCILLWYR